MMGIDYYKVELRVSPLNDLISGITALRSAVHDIPESDDFHVEPINRNGEDGARITFEAYPDMGDIYSLLNEAAAVVWSALDRYVHIDAFVSWIREREEIIAFEEDEYEEWVAERERQ
jgi:hypothetical protein